MTLAHPMLAAKHKADKAAKHLPLFGQVKLDGIRVMIQNGIAYTRSLKPVRSVQVQSFVAHNAEFLNGLDGELICGDPTSPDCYRRTDSSVMSFDKPDPELCFYVFDMWDNAAPYKDRKADLEQLDFSGLNGMAQRVDSVLLHTMEELEAYAEARIQEGHEGIMLRNPMGYYKFGRGTVTAYDLVKYKDGRWIDTEAVIFDANELRSNQNEATLDNLGRTQRSGHQENLIPMDTLGSISVRGYFPEDDGLPMHLWGRQYETRIHGLEHSYRDQLWAEHKQELLVGKIAKFKFFSGGVKDKPRFPIFLGLRDADDMSPAQVTQLSLF